MRRESVRSCAIAATMLGALVTLPSDASAQMQRPPGQGHVASAVETMQLPKFCWAQYLDVKGPEYSINGCGERMNHYCWGLVELQRANKTFGNPAGRAAYLRYAKENTLYTIRGMEKYPTCWLRSHVEKTRQEIETALRVYRVN